MQTAAEDRADPQDRMGNVARRGQRPGSRGWISAATATLAVATLLRIYDLNLKPLHHDEGVNGFFLLGLFREGVYHYNPANYHGPSLYYFAFIASSVNNLIFGGEGLTTFTLRIVPTVFGIATVAMVAIALRSRLGQVGTLTAATLIAISPGAVYLSRDFIHETLLVCFTVALVLFALWFKDTRNPKYLMLVSVITALMFATKETAAISLFILLASGALSLVLIPGDDNFSIANLGGWRRATIWGITSVAVFLAASFLLYSSFFGNLQGVYDAVATFRYWFHTGVREHTAPWHRYLEWLLREEFPIFLLACVGTALACWQRRNRFALYSGLWAFFLLVAYSILPYKTPWLLLNILVPMCLVAGFAAQELYDWAMNCATRSTRIAGVAAAVIALAACLYQSIQLNFFHYDDDRYPYVYAQTQRPFLKLIDDVQQIASRRGNTDAHIAVMSPEYWPLPWYLRDFRNVGYFGRTVQTDATIIVASENQMFELTRALGQQYQLVGAYALRPGVNLVLFVSRSQSH